MAATFYFSEDQNGMVKGSSSGEPDETEHAISLLEGNGHMILRVASSDFLFSSEQAKAFHEAAEEICAILGIT